MIGNVDVILHLVYLCVSDIGAVEEGAEEEQRHDWDYANVELEEDAARQGLPLPGGHCRDVVIVGGGLVGGLNLSVV